jgi:hypothetical protein
MINFWKSFVSWKSNRKKKAEVILFNKLLGDKNSGIPVLVEALANHKAQEFVRNWMGRHKIAMCQFCLSTGQLRRSGNGYVCPAHYGKIVDEKLKQSGRT